MKAVTVLWITYGILRFDSLKYCFYPLKVVHNFIVESAL